MRPSSTTNHHPDLAAFCMAGSVALMPLLLLLPVDWDRFLPLTLIFPLLAAARWKPPLPHNRTMILLWSCAGFTALGSALLSDHTARSIVMTSAWVLTIAGGLSAARIADSAKSLRIVLTGLAGGSAVGLICCRWLLEPDAIALPLYGHPRILGMHMLTGAIAAITLLILDYPAPRGIRILHWILAALLCGGIWWAGGRAPILGMLAVILYWSLTACSDDRRRLWTRLPLLGVLAGVVAWSAGSTFPGTGWLFPFERTLAATNFNELTSTRSEEIWSVSWRVLESPLFGHGADSYLFIRPRQVGDQPHNVLIQWMLDFGLFGTIPLIAVLLGIIWIGFRTKDQWRRFSAGGVCGCAVVALFDGIFYHTLLFIPAAVLAGLAMASPRKEEASALPHGRGIMLLTRTTLVVSAVFLLVHGWLCRQLATALPESPDALPARVLAVFPSKTYPLVRWLEHWAKTDPATALAWSQWAIPRSISADHFHLFNARLFDRHGRADLALAELEAARSVCRPTERPFYDELIGRFDAPEKQAAANDAIKESTKTNAVSDERSQQ